MAVHERADATAANAAALAEQLLYPVPEGTHAQIIANREAFDRALKHVHEHFDIADKLPKVGGRELDLYQLYRNVTELGGCAQVIAKKQWRDAAESFKFPDTITSVSFTLRKAYTQLLWDLEQIYFFQASGPRVPPPGAATTTASAAGNAASSSNGPSSQPSDNGVRNAAEAKSIGKKRRYAELDPKLFPQLPSSSPLHLTAACRGAGSPDAHAVGAKGTVTLDARFDCGYFVTAHIGRQEFKGMLYYPPTQSAEALMMSPTGEAASASSTEGRKGSAKGKDPSVPKPSRTPFNFFAAEARPRAKAAYPDAPQSDITKKVGEMWQNLPEEGKARYKAMAQADKDRYVGELEAHNYRLAAQAAQQQAMSAAQQVASLASQQQPAAAAAQLPLEPPAAVASQQLQEASAEPPTLPGVQLLPEAHPPAPQLPFFTPAQQPTGLGVYPPAPSHLPNMPHQLPPQHIPHLQEQLQLPQHQQPLIIPASMPQASSAAPRKASGHIDLPSIIEGWRPT
ncbi:probable AT-rich interactive domain-containing protein 2 at N-terminal half [Coccomyxa sp. Obi]|nr:probable AT-rich interactive domain-containing protein 2 at N-terminal half [Coccomyxa sp. Obi]